MIEEDAIRTQYEKSCKDMMEYMLSIFLQKLDDKIQRLEQLSMEKWKDGFIAGFDHNN